MLSGRTASTFRHGPHGTAAYSMLSMPGVREAALGYRGVPRADGTFLQQDAAADNWLTRKI
jgi:hypothetical protein